jgi:hypothetical protein
MYREPPSTHPRHPHNNRQDPRPATEPGGFLVPPPRVPPVATGAALIPEPEWQPMRRAMFRARAAMYHAPSPFRELMSGLFRSMKHTITRKVRRHARR